MGDCNCVIVQTRQKTNGVGRGKDVYSKATLYKFIKSAL